MLNGNAGVLLIYIPKGENNKYDAPIPLYLKDEMTGLYEEKQSKDLSINNEVVVDTTNKNTLKVLQKGVTSTVDLQLVGRQDNTGLNIILPLIDTIYDKALKNHDYKVAYYNDNILIANAKLHSFHAEPRQNTNLVDIYITLERLEKEPEEKPEENNPVPEMLGNEEWVKTTALTGGR